MMDHIGKNVSQKRHPKDSENESKDHSPMELYCKRCKNQ